MVEIQVLHVANRLCDKAPWGLDYGSQPIHWLEKDVVVLLACL
jgi:hypothetical protein